jgi:DNA-binding LacI/PurR family transcriptional regulator
MPYLIVGSSDQPEIPFVDNQNQEASRELTEIMLLKGMRKLALLCGRSSYLVTQARYQGFCEAHKKCKVDVDGALVYKDIENYFQAKRAVRDLLKRGADGIVCMDDFICSMALGCLREEKKEIPGQIRIASLYDSKQLAENQPSISSVRFDTERLGRNACLDILRILGEEIEEEIPELNYQVILRESTK